MIINQNILAILRTFSNLQKKLYGTVYTKEATSKAATTEFLNKNPHRKKVTNEQFNLCEAKLSLDEIKKIINSQENESPGNDAPQ